MLEKKVKQTIQTDIIALPPLKMTLVHAKDEQVSKESLRAAIRKISAVPAAHEEKIEKKSLIRIAEYLEKKL